MRLAGEGVLVTGSTAGIGRHVALMCAREGAAVAVHGRNAERGAAVVREIAAAGGTATFLAADLADEAACGVLVEQAAADLGGLTVLINNAVFSGETKDAAVGTLDTAHWERALRVNLSAAMWCTRAAIPHFRRAGHGSIVNVSSRQAERAGTGLTAYVASKGGLNAFTRAVAVDYGHEHIRCNALSVGYVLNPRRDGALSATHRARLEGMHLTRLGQPDDVAYACVYLASQESEFVTGALLPVDGGGTIARGLVLG